MTQPSCYLLEFSVGSGGARKGDIYAAGTLADVRRAFEEADHLDPYLLLWYGSCLRLWVVRHGTVTGGVDLRPYVRCTDPAYDATVRRLLLDPDGTKGDLLDDLDGALSEHGWDMLAALPLLDRVLALRDRGGPAAEAGERLAVAAAETGDLPLPASGRPVAGLWLDWAALGRRAPALEAPLLTEGPVSVALARGVPRDPDSYLCAGVAGELVAGANNLE
ncbi:hypothetical protein [Streptomyces carpaticus]|uniref:Uncharacterized protein n=1 Tax=Streptomyces carpaticus TaxID=285558 RepID=A0ABV4ZKQ6_9ACTN